MNQSKIGTQGICWAALTDQDMRMNSAGRTRKSGTTCWAAPAEQSMRMSSGDQRQKAGEMCWAAQIRKAGRMSCARPADAKG